MAKVVQNIKDLEKLTIEEQVKYINDSIKKGGSLVAACNQIGVKKTMLKKMFKRKNYEYNEQEHRFQKGGNGSTPVEELKQDIETTNKEMSKKQRKRLRGGEHTPSEVHTQKIVEVIEGGDGSTFEIQDRKVQENIVALANDYDILKMMIDDYKSNYMGRGGTSRTQGAQEVIEVVTGIQINLPQSESFKTSIRVNKVVWEDYKMFMKKHSEFTNVDLISQALVEFMKKHNK